MRPTEFWEYETAEKENWRAKNGTKPGKFEWNIIYFEENKAKDILKN